METDGHSFRELLRRARSGETDAMDELLSLLRSHLERVARNYVDRDDASESVSDLVQESWVRAWDRLDQFSGGEEDGEAMARFRAWTSQIVRTLALQARRTRRRQKRSAPGGRVIRLRGPGSSIGGGSPEPAAGGSTPSGLAWHEERARLIREAIERIADADQREAIRLRFFEGLSLRGIAERLDLTYDQVRDRFHRGMQEVEGVIRDID